MDEQRLSYSRLDMHDVVMTPGIFSARAESDFRAKFALFAPDLVTLVALSPETGR